LPPEAVHTGLEQAATAFGVTFTVALVLIALCLIPGFLLPKNKPPTTMDPETAAAAMAH
jgi:hypothetical protein